jgi:hypothetical protein
MLTKPSAARTLFDTLSQLTFVRATKLLGPRGDHLIATGGKHDIDVTTQVKFDQDRFRLTLDSSTVTLALSPAARHREVALASGMEELKQRLEVLLGAKPHGAVNETEKQRQQQEAERLARRSRVAEAGGQLLAAAFTFLSEMIPQREPGDGATRMARELNERLNDCLERDDQGRPRLTVTLPNDAALANFARSLAALLA